MTSHFSLTFHGCRGSFPVTGADFQRYGGNSPCVSIQAGSRTIILDAGSGLVEHGNQMLRRYASEKVAMRADIFITHLHLDHLMGLPFFSPIYLPQASVNVWGPRMGAYPSFEAALNTLIHPPFFPVPIHEMQAAKTFHDITEAHSVYYLKDQAMPVMLRKNHPDTVLPDPDDIEVEVHCMRGFNHPKSGVLLYKVIYQGHTIVYATDTEGYVHGDQRLSTFAMGADVLIHDAMYTSDRYTSMPSPTQGYGHSTVEIAADVATRADVKKLLLFHHDPSSTDDDLDAIGEMGKRAFAHTEVARDGLTIEII
jgi:ribonuclease BN (tRNA processing enzyme)